MDFAPLETIHIDEVSDNNTSCSKLLTAAQSPGFFYLDLARSEFQHLKDDVGHLQDLSHEYFSSTASAKEKDMRAGIERGYKSGTWLESFEMARDELSLPSLVFPGIFSSHQTCLDRAIRQCDKVTKAVLKNLARALVMEETDLIRNACDETRTSDSSLKLISAPAFARRQDHPDTTHTDGGILTLLWGSQVSSQILDPRTGRWVWVDAKPDCVLVNVGDTLQDKTARRLHSCVHRIAQDSDEEMPRYFVSYYLRS